MVMTKLIISRRGVLNNHQTNATFNQNACCPTRTQPLSVDDQASTRYGCETNSRSYSLLPRITINKPCKLQCLSGTYVRCSRRLPRTCSRRDKSPNHPYCTDRAHVYIHLPYALGLSTATNKTQAKPQRKSALKILSRLAFFLNFFSESPILSHTYQCVRSFYREQEHIYHGQLL